MLTLAYTIGKKLNITVKRGCLSYFCIKNNTKQKHYQPSSRSIFLMAVTTLFIVAKDKPQVNVL